MIMNRYITNIKINKLLHLNNFDIPIADDNHPHLIITGKNGSGKTILLNAVADFLDELKDTTHPDNDRINLEINAEKYRSDDFILAFYKAERKPEMSEPQNPTKPKLKFSYNIKDYMANQFLNFLSDMKIQEALARNENQLQDADEIKNWFDDFEKLLGEIYQDDKLKLEFNYRDYSFKICTEGKSFKFTELADGFSAILDIVADLILKMQEKSSFTRSYKKEGIVLIDEIETHLHLALQKTILPLLTKVFPNVQFIVTTHSPFVMNSCDTAVAYDLEHRKILADLNEYSYESLAEGYFGVETESSYAQMQLDKFKTLLAKYENTETEIASIRQFVADFEKIPEAISPIIVGQYRQLTNQYSEKIRRYVQ